MLIVNYRIYVLVCDKEKIKQSDVFLIFDARFSKFIFSFYKGIKKKKLKLK